MATIMELDKRNKLYFHCTQSKSLTKEFVELSPRGSGINRSSEEPMVFRTCVSPTIAACLAAADYSCCSPIRIYACETRAWTPYKVKDSKITGEKWLLESTEFIKVAIIEKRDTHLFKFCDGYATLARVKHNRKILHRLLNDGRLNLINKDYCDLSASF